jgi:hypothetical protein
MDDKMNRVMFIDPGEIYPLKLMDVGALDGFSIDYIEASHDIHYRYDI